MRKRLLAAGAATAGLVVGLPALPAAAGPEASGRFGVEVESGKDNFVAEDFCGVKDLTVEVHETFRSRGFFTFRGSDSIPHFTGTSQLKATYTEQGTGTTVRLNGSVVNEDISIQVDGDQATITALGAGGFRIAGPEGALQNPGRVFVQFVIDSKGTLQDPDDDTLVGEVVVLRPSTGLNEGTEDFCTDYLAVTGRAG